MVHHELVSFRPRELTDGATVSLVHLQSFEFHQVQPIAAAKISIPFL